jgi:hypothetical protein
VELKNSPELFLAGQDDLAISMYGQINRVTVEINAESRTASTSFVITHLRNQTENSDPRTSIAQHPLYGSNVTLGVPLVPAYEFNKYATPPVTLPPVAGAPT